MNLIDHIFDHGGGDFCIGCGFVFIAYLIHNRPTIYKL